MLLDSADPDLSLRPKLKRSGGWVLCNKPGGTVSLLPAVDGMPHLHVLLGKLPGLVPVVHPLPPGEHRAAQDAGAKHRVSLQQRFALVKYLYIVGF